VEAKPVHDQARVREVQDQQKDQLRSLGLANLLPTPNLLKRKRKMKPARRSSRSLKMSLKKLMLRWLMMTRKKKLKILLFP
jgi:hypothetical protein